MTSTIFTNRYDLARKHDYLNKVLELLRKVDSPHVQRHVRNAERQARLEGYDK